MTEASLSPESLFDLGQTLAGELFASCRAAWEVLPEIGAFLSAWSPPEDFIEIGEQVWVGRGTELASSVEMRGPALIGRGCELRSGVLIRGNAIVGDGVILGNSSEVKNAILFNRVQAPHYSYIGDSVLGHRVHLGAGVIVSNVKITGGPIRLMGPGGEPLETNLEKLGALIGDGAEIGCNSVLCPGTVIGRRSIVYPLTVVRGWVPADSILKSDGSLTPRTDPGV
jgi:NDP-sugar pyrophosphorylase family protein